ncbi:MAG TPA: PA14 domain-containing protein [Phycisphaerales bacterium]|nr:PA14 domain-containing protein [Phycisphaerales bacterium]
MRPNTRPAAGPCLASLLAAFALTQAGVLHAAQSLGSITPASTPPIDIRAITPNDGGGKSLAPNFKARPGIVEFSGQLIARPLQTLTPADRARIDAAVASAGSVLKYYPEVDEYVIDVTPSAPAAGSVTPNSAAPHSAMPGSAENARAGELMRTGLFEYVHPNWICYPLDRIPNDPQFSSQWHHTVMQSAKAWDITTGSSSITCAFTDTGIDLTHPDLAAARVPGFNAVTDLAEVNGGDVSETGGHGTHVSGCGAAIGNNGVGVAGCGWNMKIMMVRVQEPGWGGAYLDDILQGARWAIENGAKVASSSYGGVDYWAVGTTGTYIKSIGGLYCYAAGNDGRDLNFFDYPDTIVCGASHAGEDRTGWSGYGLAVDVFAPGDNILSSCWGGGWCGASGTSMATPVTNGVIAMIWSANPSLTPQQVENILFAACQDWGAPGNDDIYGWGRVNTFRAVQAAVSFGSNKPVAVDDYVGKMLTGTSKAIDVLANDFDPETQALTITNFNPTTTKGGAVTLSPGTGPGGRDQLLYTAPANATGEDSFTYTVKDPTNLSDNAVVRIQLSTLDSFRNPDNPLYTKPGIEGAYYDASGLSALPDFSTLTPYTKVVRADINIAAGGGNFGDSGRADNVAAVFEGWITIPSTDWYTFYTTSDDGSRLLIGDTVVVTNDGLHGATEAGGEIALKAGTHRIRVEYFEAGGDAALIVSAASSTMSKQVIPASMWRHGNFADGDFRNPENPSSTAAGLEASYYATGTIINSLPNLDPLTPVKTSVVDQINYPSTTGVFADSGLSNGVSARFTGYLSIPQTGFYTLYTNSDEGSKLWIGNTLVVDNNGLHTMRERSGTIGLKAGLHAIKVDYFERTGEAGLIVSYDGQDLPKQVIPPAAFARTNPCSADFDGSGFVDIEDYTAFVVAFEAGDQNADFDGSGFVDIEDFTGFVVAFESGC